eukprot:UN28603
MKIRSYSAKHDMADCVGLEDLFFDGQYFPWDDNIQIRKRFFDGELFFMNADIAKVEKEKARFVEIFNTIDEQENAEMDLNEFITGICIYQDFVHHFSRQDLTDVFYEIVEEDSDGEECLELDDFIEFMSSEHTDEVFQRFQKIQDLPTPVREQVFCKQTKTEKPKSQCKPCADCRQWVWKRAGETHARNPTKIYCGTCFEKHRCKNIITDEKTGGKIRCGRWQLKKLKFVDDLPHCKQCYSEKSQHFVRKTFECNYNDLPFDIDVGSSKPRIINVTADLILDDIVNGSHIHAINKKKVEHLKPSKVEKILRSKAPPILITFKVYSTEATFNTTFRYMAKFRRFISEHRLSK